MDCYLLMIVITSQSSADLQTALNLLNLTIFTGALRWISKKTKVMLIHDKGKCQMTYKGQFKYLGFIVHKSGKLKFGIEDFGLKAMTNVFRIFNKNWFLFPQNAIVNYGAMVKQHQLNKMKFSKYILEVPLTQQFWVNWVCIQFVSLLKWKLLSFGIEFVKGMALF